MPDINSLLPSRSSGASPSQSRTPPPPAAASSANGGPDQDGRHPSTPAAGGSRSTPIVGGPTPPRFGRLERASAGMANLHLHDVAGTHHAESFASALAGNSPQGAGGPSYVTADPHHQRAPSLGGLHQELEQEQEAQVNRLLQMIRQQQIQVRQLQQAGGPAANESAATDVEDSTPTSERSLSFPTARQTTVAAPANPRASTELSRRSSHRSLTPSRNGSPAIRPLSAGVGGPTEVADQGWLLGAGRTDSEFYRAETQMLARENMMLRMRIRELERQVTDLNLPTPASLSHANPSATPSTPSVAPDDATAARETSGSADEAKT